MDKHLKRLEKTVKESLSTTMEEFDKLDPRVFGEKRHTETFRVKRRSKKYNW